MRKLNSYQSLSFFAYFFPISATKLLSLVSDFNFLSLSLLVKLTPVHQHLLYIFFVVVKGISAILPLNELSFLPSLSLSLYFISAFKNHLNPSRYNHEHCGWVLSQGSL